MFLTAFLIGGQRAIIDITHPTAEQLAGNAPLKWEAAVSTGYANVTDILNLDKHYFSVFAPVNEVRNELITTFISLWATATPEERKALVRWYVYPATATVAELDALYTLAERDAFKLILMNNLNRETTNYFSVWKDTINGKFYKAYSADRVTEKAEITTYSIL